MIALARCVFAIPGSQIDNERVFSVAGVISKNRRNRIGVQNIDSMHIYHNFPDVALDQDSAPSLAEIASDQSRSNALQRYVSQLNDSEIDLLVDVEENSTVIEAE